MFDKSPSRHYLQSEQTHSPLFKHKILTQVYAAHHPNLQLHLHSHHSSYPFQPTTKQHQMPNCFQQKTSYMKNLNSQEIAKMKKHKYDLQASSSSFSNQ